MSPERVGLGALAAAVVLATTSVSARPLELSELYAFEQYLHCAYTTCEADCAAVRGQDATSATYADVVDCERCLADEACGQPPRIWEKDGVAPVSWADHDLAVLEQLQPDQICYADPDETIVRPLELCPGAGCEARLASCLADPETGCAAGTAAVDCRDERYGRVCWYDAVPQAGCPDFVCAATGAELTAYSAAVTDLCTDADGDGLPAWAQAELSGALGGTAVACATSDDCADGQVCAPDDAGALVCQVARCDLNSPCGFFEMCVQGADGALPTCVPRGQCSADGTGTGGGTEPIGETCDPTTGTCVACVYDADCGTGARCASGTCLAAERCVSTLDCAGDLVCDPGSNYCVTCVTAAECGDGEHCTADGMCAATCASDLECAGAGELCDPVLGRCVACVGDDTCGFGTACVLGRCRPTECSDGTRCAVVDTPTDPAEAACTGDLDCRAEASPSGCTAFHLEKVSEDDVEVLVHVHYDYSPVPARVLDLYLDYDDSQLVLEDARPLPPLALNGKRLASSHLSDGTLVLNLFDTDGTHPIPRGPVVELVFRRVGVCATQIAFTDRVELREDSIAPIQGTAAIQKQLGDDRLWGDPITLCKRSEISPRLRLWYGFETTDEPLSYQNVPTAAELCEVYPDCALEEDAEVKARVMTRLERLQAGELQASERIDGVTRDAVYLDGAADHLRTPVQLAATLDPKAQSFSYSTWFYSEGNSPNELTSTPQLLYSHNASNERTAFGLMAVETGGDTMGLVLFQGDLLDPRLSGEALLQGAETLVPGQCAAVDPLTAPGAQWIATGIPIRTWHHVGFTLDADHAPETARFDLYWDGEPVGCVEVTQPPDAVACPQLSVGTDVLLHDEGDVLGGRSPEFVYMAVNRSNLYKIERMDPGGLTSTTVIGDSEFSYRDPDYSPILDRLVYSSNASGDWEIWMSRGDGSARVQLTDGFGDSFRDITARRPRWAPDGTGIVFDSNVFDVLADDNAYAFVRHVYYIGYDPIENAVAITLADNSTTDVLDYQARLADQTIADYRLTSALDRQHRNARWLTGERDDDPTRSRGALLIDVSDADFGRHRVQLLTIPDALPLASTAAVAGLGVADEIRMIDAFHSEQAAFPQPIVTERLLIQRENQIWEPDDQFTLACDGGACAAGHTAAEIVLTHAPSGYDPRCWDANFNAVADADEDRNGDGVWDVDDCYPATMDVYVSYDAARYAPILDVAARCTDDSDCDGGQVCDAGTELCAVASTDVAECEVDGDCGADELCQDEVCRGVFGGVLGCNVEADCDPLGGTCYRGLCHAEGDVQAACLDETDCPGGRGCVGSLCQLDTGDIGGLAQCDADGDCDPGQTCDLGYCKVLGYLADTGVPTPYRPCVVHQDCEGGQVCSDGTCAASSGLSSCTSATEATACEGGSLCRGGRCVVADGADPTSADGDDCELQTDCTGGQICDFAAGVCKDAAGPLILSEQGEAIFGVFGKKLKLATRFATVDGRARALLRVQVLSPQSAAPIGAGAVVKLRFEERGTSAAPSFAPEVYGVHSDVVVAVKDLRAAGLPTIFERAGTFERVVDGAFSPDGDQLLLAAISAARPILLRTRDLQSAIDAERVTVSPVRADGLRWVRESRLYACNWAGAYLHLQSKALMYGWRGGLDDLRLYTGLRDPDAFRSEAERGFEFLAQNDQDGVLPSRLPECGNSHVECPPFHLCVASECRMVPCDPTDPWSCAASGGRCTLRPESVEQENPSAAGSTAGWDWVCAADCTTDNQCFTEACLNGPCRFCDAGSLTCLECRESVQQVGALSISGIEGCPDRRSFDCEAGACVTDCYAFEDGQSIYLCDPTTEYCDAGRCVLLDWDWWDLAPASFAGLGVARRELPPDPANGWNGYTQAVDQRIPISISAYGVEDWRRSPELLVEVRGGPFYSSEWHTVGKLIVHHRTRTRAQSEPYLITSPHPFNDLRLRLVTSPVGNPTGGATGLREHDVPFCVASLLANVLGATDTLARATCSALAQGSRYLVGYPVGVPDNDAIAFCRSQGHAGCPLTAQGEHDFLQGGQPAVAVVDVQVDGGGAMNNITSNTVCSYEGGLGAIDDGAAAKLTYGPFGDELSNQARGLRARCEPSEVPADFRGLWTGDDRATAEGPAQDGVAHLLSYGGGRVGRGFVFDGPADYLSPSPDVVSGDLGFTVEAWVRTGDLRGGLLSMFSRPESCAAWKAAGRVEDGRYTIWPDNRPRGVYCAGMGDLDTEPATYIELASETPGANTSRYLAGGGSFGTPVETTYTKLRYDPVTQRVDVGDQAFASDNGGRLGDGCVPPDRADDTQPGCVVAVGRIEHLWRGEGDATDAASAVASRSWDIGFTAGRIGQALSFSGLGGAVATSDGLPDDARGLTVEGWVRTVAGRAQTIARQADDVTRGGWELGVDPDGALRFTVVGGVDADGEGAALVGQTDVGDGAWHHVAAVLDGTDGDVLARIWVDGQLDAEVADANPWIIPPLVLPAGIVVGQGRNGARGFGGDIDDLAVWSKALDLDDILQVDATMIARIHALGAVADGPGDGKCLPEEVIDLPLCAPEDIVTTLPAGVAARCDGPLARATASLDLTGTPFSFAGDGADVFTRHGVGTGGDVVGSDQIWTVSAGGRCGVVTPTGVSGDLGGAVTSAAVLPVRLLDDAVDLPRDCDADCRARVLDELAAVTLTPDGLEVRVADRVHTASRPGYRLADRSWHHVALVRDRDRVTLYVDGVVWLATTDVPYLTGTDAVDRVVVGQDGACAASPERCASTRDAFAGQLDELAFYARPLGLDEVRAIVDAGAEGRPVDHRPALECPDDDDGLVDFDRDLYGYALLNCNYYSPLPGERSASIDFQNIIIQREWPARRGAITDNGDSCSVELDAVRTEPCYAWTGDDVSIDPGNDGVDVGSYTPFQSLEFGLFRSFGHDEGFERIPGVTYQLGVWVGGLPSGERVKIGWTPGGEIPRPLGNGGAVLGRLLANRQLEIHVAEDPPGYLCRINEDLFGQIVGGQFETCGNCISGPMPESNFGVGVYCEPKFGVAVTIPAEPAGIAVSGQVVDVYGATVSAENLADSDFVTGLTQTFRRLHTVAGQGVVATVTGPAGYSCTIAESTDSAPDDDTATAVVTDVAGDIELVVTCVTADTYGLDVEVADLATNSTTFDCGASPPTGLELTDRETGVSLCVGRDGVHALAGASYLAGAPWDLYVSRQPTAPPSRVCSVVSNGAGTMPDLGDPDAADFAGLSAALRPRVTCVTPTNAVGVQILGLQGSLELALVRVGTGAGGADEQLVTRTVASTVSSPSPPPIDVTFDDAPLVDGVDFRVEVLAQPDGQTCSVTPTQATTPLPDGIVLNITCSDIPEPTYTIGGTISGLTGDQMRLALNLGAVKLDVPSGTTSFVFAYDAEDLSDYSVAVDRQPTGQRCTVANDEGIIEGASVSDVVVTCVDVTRLSVTVQGPGGFEGARVKALLFSTGSGIYLAGEENGGSTSPTIEAGLATFELPPDGGDFPALSAGRSYELFVFLSRTTDEATGGSTFVPGSTLVTVKTIAIPAQPDEVTAVSVSAGDFSGSTPGLVTVISPTTTSLADNDAVACVWTPAGAHVPVPPFASSDANVIARSVFVCGDEDGCDVGTVATNQHDPLPLGDLLDVTCWADVDGNGNLSGGDLWGRSPSSQTNAAIVLMSVRD